MRIYRIQYGETTLPESMVFPGGKADRQIPIILSFFLVETADRRILVDVGCDTMPGFTLKNFQKPVVALEKMGVVSSDITDIILTHAHHDHIDAVRYFPDASIHIHADELAKAAKYLPEGARLHIFREDFSLDEQIRVVKIGGHSAGSCVVEIDEGDHVTVLCGDECYSSCNLTGRIPTATSCVPENSKAFIEKYTQPPYRPLLCHDDGLTTSVKTMYSSKEEQR